jgi:uncharacterized protein (DUF488 family)
MKVYTIGHSNLTWESFLDLLKKHEIETVLDVRATPYSRYAPWSRKKKLFIALIEEEIEYVYLGNELGGKPFEKITDFYDRERNPLFVVGIQKLIDIARVKRTVILCAEAKPDRCHRQNIIGRHLVNRGWQVIHILRNGDSIEQQPMLL